MKKDKLLNIIYIALFIILYWLKDKFDEEKIYWGLVVLLLLIVIIRSNVKLRRFVKKYSKCPQCGAPAEKGRRTCYVNPKEEKVYIGGMRVIDGEVKRNYMVMSCTECDWEKEYK